MARSFQGGTRGFIRGKVASDLYQVTQDKRGRRIQLVRAVESSRVNNNTKLQALSRMQMALLMGSLKQFREIVDHSFETIPYGQLSIAHFVEINMPLIQADCREHWDENNQFDYPTKGTTDVRAGLFKIAEGSLSANPIISWGRPLSNLTIGCIFFNSGSSTPTVGSLKSKLGVNVDDYITALVICGSGLRRFNRFKYLRFYWSGALSDNTRITSSNVSQLFRTEGNLTIRSVTIDSGGTIIFQIGYQENGVWFYMYEGAFIYSVWDGVRWLRNNSTFEMMPSVTPDMVPFETPFDNFATWWSAYDGETYEELFGDR